MPDLSALLRKAEIQQKQLQLEVRFKQNMAVFERVAPALYREYIDYQPQELRLCVDDDGEVQLVNAKLNNRPVYSTAPRTFCRQQFEQYCQRPSIASIRIYKTQDQGRFEQVRQINQLLDRYGESINSPEHVSCNVPIGMMVVTGCGLGYHLEEMIDKLDIYTLFLFDPHKDSFYASLHTVDWGAIIAYFARERRMLKLCIGLSVRDTMRDMTTLADKIGLFNMASAFVYRHFHSTEEKQFIRYYREKFHLAATGIGFLEDEQISLSHTVANINAGIPVLTHDKSTPPLPAVIVGNGPSLAGLIPLLRECRQRVIIFSCGSATGTLCKADILPDFHIEMERTRSTADVIRVWHTPEHYEKVTLLALNTVAPDTFSLFKNAAMAKKPNDVGCHIVDDISGKKLPELSFCNPTVTNCGLSFAVYMGFKEIYLLGVDLGMTDMRQHHAKDSVYEGLEEKYLKEYEEEIAKTSYAIGGNLRDSVFTTTDLDASRQNMEMIIKYGKGVTVYNPNDGAKIHGAITVRPEALSLPETNCDKAGVMASLKTAKFAAIKQGEISEDFVRERYLQDFFKLESSIRLPSRVKGIADIHTLLDKSFRKLIAAESPVSVALLRGSTNAFFTVIMRACIFAASERQRSETYQHCRKTFNAFIKNGYKLIRETPLKHDDIENFWGTSTDDRAGQGRG